MDVADRMCVIVSDVEAARRDDKSNVARGSLANIEKMCRVQEACKNNAAQASKSQKIKKVREKGKSWAATARKTKLEDKIFTQ